MTAQRTMGEVTHREVMGTRFYKGPVQRYADLVVRGSTLVRTLEELIYDWQQFVEQCGYAPMEMIPTVMALQEMAAVWSQVPVPRPLGFAEPDAVEVVTPRRSR